MKASAESLVPGIGRYPDLAAQLRDKLGSTRGCSACNARKLAASYRTKLAERLERDKWLKKP